MSFVPRTRFFSEQIFEFRGALSLIFSLDFLIYQNLARREDGNQVPTFSNYDYTAQRHGMCSVQRVEKEVCSVQCVERAGQGHTNAGPGDRSLFIRSPTPLTTTVQRILQTCVFF